ncbi:MAG TPA: hypothetical protein P5316_13650 [Phycisphaerae bacterium]|nr:hypothetical protein [Phycisphaerae bacterium]
MMKQFTESTVESAALATSVDLVCRPRSNDASVGDLREILRELPKRITGDLRTHKWTNSYTKVLAKFATTGDMRLNVSIEITPDGGVPPHRMEETKAAKRAGSQRRGAGRRVTMAGNSHASRPVVKG